MPARKSLAESAAYEQRVGGFGGKRGAALSQAGRVWRSLGNTLESARRDYQWALYT
jgi:hypothetical protein